jgi:putative ABC transport system substrate-binding protein
MKRRALILASGAWAALVAARVSAQQPGGLPRIGWLSPTTRDGPFPEAFIARLRELGRVEGRDFVLEYRGAEGKPERLPALAAEIVARRPAVILTASTAAATALKNATRSIPIVFASAGDPVEQGLVASLGRPGGNITGVTVHMGLSGKVMELVREVKPAATHVAYLVHTGDPVSKRAVAVAQRNASAVGVELILARVSRAEDLERAFAELKARKLDALIVPNLSMFIAAQTDIARLALEGNLPIFSTLAGLTRAGGLISYDTDYRRNYRRAAELVDRILKGANPADMPVEQPERFQMVVNLKTARALGMKLPQSVLLRTDEVIE